MTLYLVKHAEGDVRLHRPDGSEAGPTFTEKPSEAALREAIIGNGNIPSVASVGPKMKDVGDVNGGNLIYRDLTIPGETVPWA